MTGYGARYAVGDLVRIETDNHYFTDELGSTVGRIIEANHFSDGETYSVVVQTLNGEWRDVAISPLTDSEVIEALQDALSARERLVALLKQSITTK